MWNPNKIMLVAGDKEVDMVPAYATPEEKAAFVERFDWRRMTEQDDEVWNKIFEALEK